MCSVYASIKIQVGLAAKCQCIDSRVSFQVALSVLRATAFESSTSNPLHKNRSSVNERDRDIVVRVLIELFFPDVGRVTYAEMLYRTNLIAYVPADHVTGLPSNVGRRRHGIFLPR